MFLSAVKALPLTALQLRHLQRPCWGPTEPEGRQRWHVYSCLGQSLSEWHFITKSRLQVDRYGGREEKSKTKKSEALVAAPWGCIIHWIYNLKVLHKRNKMLTNTLLLEQIHAEYVNFYFRLVLQMLPHGTQKKISLQNCQEICLCSVIRLQSWQFNFNNSC